VCVCVLNMGLFKYFVSTWIIKYIFPFVVFLLWLNFVKDFTFQKIVVFVHDLILFGLILIDLIILLIYFVNDLVFLFFSLN
jgi:hypothetical protein